MNALIAGIIAAIQAIAVKLLSQRFFEAMLVVGLRKLSYLDKSPIKAEVVNEVAKALGREDLVKP